MFSVHGKSGPKNYNDQFYIDLPENHLTDTNEKQSYSP